MPLTGHAAKVASAQLLRRVQPFHDLLRRLGQLAQAPHSAIDEFSRLAYTEALPNEKARTAIAFLSRARAFFTTTASQPDPVRGIPLRPNLASHPAPPQRYQRRGLITSRRRWRRDLQVRQHADLQAQDERCRCVAATCDTVMSRAAQNRCRFPVAFFAYRSVRIAIEVKVEPVQQSITVRSAFRANATLISRLHGGPAYRSGISDTCSMHANTGISTTPADPATKASSRPGRYDHHHCDDQSGPDHQSQHLSAPTFGWHSQRSTTMPFDLHG
jgi:hypothetical protein